MRSPRAYLAERKRRRQIAGKNSDWLVGLTFALGGAFLFIAFFTFIDARDHSLAQDLTTTGVTTTAHDGQIRPDCQYKGCSGNDRVRVTADLPDGPRVLELRGVYPDTDGLPTEKWSNAPAGNQYAGNLTVTYDPTNLTHAMEGADLRNNAAGGDVRDDLLALAICGVLILALVALQARDTIRHSWRRRARKQPALHKL